MQYRRVGSSDVRLSVVGFGTCQLRLVPEEQALATLKRGFDLGVNWVHVSPDYCGAEELAARAIRESGRDVIPVSDGSGTMEHFEGVFENTCRIFGRRRLPLWGISCIDDQEFVGHDVWGEHGMVESALRKKREGRIDALFCSTHAPPEYVERLIESGCFDAVMLAYNPLGFHVLSYYAKAETKIYEDLAGTRERILGLAKQRGVGLLVMKPLAGGLLGRSKAFPPHELLAREREAIEAHEVLRYVLAQDGVTAVVPGTASVAEAEENALAGHVPIELAPERVNALESRVAAMRATLCSRCGKCEPTCSRGLPISWMFRDAYMWMNPSDTFDAVGRLHYFHLHPEAALACATCTERTCTCPQGLDVPLQLSRVHERMLDLRARSLLPRTPAELDAPPLGDGLAVRVVYSEVPREIAGGAPATCRLWLENAGNRVWAREESAGERVVLDVLREGVRVQSVALREDVHPGNRLHVTFALQPSSGEGAASHRFVLRQGGNVSTELLEATITTTSMDPRPEPASKSLQWKWWKSDAARAAPPPPSAPPPPPPSPELRPTHGVLYVSHDVPPQVAPGLVFPVRLELENTGAMTWHAWTPNADHVGLAVAWDGKIVVNHKLPRQDVHAGERVTLHFAVDAPLVPGQHRLSLNLVQYQVAMFADRGSPALEIDVEVEAREVANEQRLWADLQRFDPWHFLPTRGIARRRSGEAFPVFAARANGGRLWDASGKEYIDYTMGWGSVLLGYAHPRVREALAAMLDTGPTLAFPTPIEIEVARMLCEDFPSAQMVCFGKNGSDACTFAVRMARNFTKRRTVLFSGYHGWQDFWVEQLPFERTGVPPRERPLIHRFRFNDADDFERLLAEHRSDVAAVMLEPSPWKGDGLGFDEDTDATFLRRVADSTRAAGALLVFDEIVTGYRYPGGSVQQAKGVTPDLTCLGKAIASGMPLSAVVGREDVFREALPKSYYAATFHGETYSFAAAKASIEVYRSEPVARHVWDYGTKLRDGTTRLARELGLAASAKGPPFRMSFLFDGPEAALVQLQRTLFQQELLAAGVTTYNGIMLPCYAHDEATLARTLEAFGLALSVVARATERGNFDDVLEIAPLIDL